MSVAGPRADRKAAESGRYILDEQIGFILRQVSQRHGVIFSQRITGDLTSTQWAALSKLAEVGPSSQNQLGRLTAMDVATIKGVVDRLARRGLVESEPDPTDGRRRVVALSEEGGALVAASASLADDITRETLAPLDADEQATLLRLLKKLR